MHKTIQILTILIIALSCKEQLSETYNDYKVEGVDRHGNSRVCFNAPGAACNSVASVDEEEFAQKCESEGNLVHPCGCQEFVCEQKSFKGVDLNGQERTCRPTQDDLICTQEFTDNDQFALDCENNGGQAIQCGCHDYICTFPEEISSDKISNAKEILGTNQDGIKRSCRPEKNLNCPTEISRAHVYAQNCREEGHAVAWCSCDEVLCID
jgi:hypothetical protein